MSRVITFHMELEEESDASFRFYYNNASTGLPINITGYRAEMHVRQGFAGNETPEPLLVLTSQPNEGLVIGGAQGTVDVFISYEDTRDKYWQNAKYNIYLITPVGTRIPFVKGFFVVNKSATRLINTGLTDISNPSSVSPNNLGKGGEDSNSSSS